MPPGLISRNEQPASGGITVGWLLAIALGGGALLFVTLAFILVTITDRRTHKAQLQARQEAALVSNDEDTTSTDGTYSSRNRPQNRRRLTKSPQISPSREKRRSLPHILPHIKRNSSILSLFGNGSPSRTGPGKGQHSRRKNSWIDEDAIHGPEMKRRESKLISLRESWLMMRTPTLPALLGYRDDPDTEPFYRHQNYPLIMAPRPATLSGKSEQSNRQPTSRMPLVRTPSYELAQQRAAAIRFGADESQQHQQQQQQDIQQQQQYHQQTQHHENQQRQHEEPQNRKEHHVPTDSHLIPNGPRPPPAAKLARIRTVNTDSNLQLILRNTAERLRDVSPGPIRRPTHGRNADRPNPQAQAHPKGHRRTPASQESPIKGFRNERVGPSVMTEYRGVHKTPSPKKMPVQAMTTPQSAPAALSERQQRPQVSPTKQAGSRLTVHGSGHQRNMSTSSMLSEHDSLFGESVPDHGETVIAGLSSPSRRSSQNSAVDQPSAQVIQQRRRSVSIPSMRSSVSSALSTVYSEEEAEPDRSRTGRPRTQQDAPTYRGRAPRRQGHVSKMSDPFLTVDPAPKLPERSPRRMSVKQPNLGHQYHHSSQDAAILGQISGNAQSATNSPVMSSPILGKEREHIRLSILMDEPPQFSTQGNVRPRSVVPMKPTLNTSTSVASMRADPSTPEDDRRGHRPRTSHGRRTSVVPPPLNLCPIAASPRMEDGDGKFPAFNLNVHASESMNSLPSSPPENRPLPDPELMSPTWTHLKRGGYLEDTPSRANSNASARSSVYSETHRGPRDDPRTSSPIRADPARYTPRSNGSITKRSSPVRMSPLTASIIQLRRMNSQMSSYSAASSMLSDTVAPDSPTLPTLRGGGFSPDRSNSRIVKAGRQNYLSMGTPSPKPKRTTTTATRAEGAGDEKENGGKRQDDKGPALARGGLKGSFRSTESPRRRMSVRFGDVKEHVFVDNQGTPTPPPIAADKQKLARPTAGSDPDRSSADSLGLYDKDGFLMSSPDRLPSSAAEGATGRPRGGLRM